jgi:uncharacterized repeat protein (TIGR03803 family)
VFALAIFLTQTAQAQTLTTLYAFSFGPNESGAYPYAGLVQGTDGNFYGTTSWGGDYYYCQQSTYAICGMVFKITPAGTLTNLYDFCYWWSGCGDGAAPRAGLVQGTDGNFYGTTRQGGYLGCYTGCGTVFQITPSGTLTTLHTFDGTDGSDPYAGLVQGTDGNFYGTTSQGGGGPCNPYGCGTVFQITPAGTLTTLHSFAGSDGAFPHAGLVQATDGNFYGTTSGGGASGNCGDYGCGTVFKITAGGTLTTLYSFCSQSNCPDGNSPYAGLVQATDENFYGTTQYGGTSGNCGGYNCGTVFKITAGGTLTTLYSFEGTDGAVPLATLVQATDGNFYGTTLYGGTSGNCGARRCGTIFKITPAGTLTMLHSFDDTDGSAPYGALIQATDGNFYGTTEGGDSGGHYDVYGTVFSLTGPGPQLIPTTTVLMTAPNPSNLGQPVTMTATVTAQNGSIPTGTVVFESNGAQVGSASLNSSGVAVLVYAGLSAGTDSLTAIYQGSATLAGSTSNTVPQVVSPGSTTTTVTSSPNPSTFGEAVTITATVSPSGPPAPTGTVSFTSNGSAISGCTAVPLTSSLTAVCTTSTLAVGTDAIVATYSGDTNYSGSSGSLSQLVNPTPSPLQFVAVTPCRLVDTRPQYGGSGPIPGGTYRSFPILQEGGCNIPTSAAAYSLNVTVVPQGQLGYLTIWPTGQGQPLVATLNSLDGRIKADAAIVPAGDQGAISIYVTNTTNVVLDINGYFAPASGSTLAFYPLPPCRVADTRHSTYPPGLGPPYLTGHTERQFPILNATSCNIPASAEAYSLNFSVVPHGGLGYLTVWPTGQSQPLVSTLNDLVAQIIANAAIVPAGTSGDVSVYPSSDTDLVIDINGYFAPAGMGGLSLYPTAPCRVIDTRHVGSGQPFSGTLSPPVNVVGSQCEPPAAAQAYVFNATVVPTGALGYLTLWPDGTTQPLVSTLNALDGSISSNMAIVPTNNGSVDAYASGITQLILDISSYFAP